MPHINDLAKSHNRIGSGVRPVSPSVWHDRIRTEGDTRWGEMRFKNAFDKANNEPVTGRKFSTKPLAIDLPHNAILYSIGLELPPKLPLEAWTAIGRQLVKVECSMQWALGDWWAYGFHQYGKRKEIAQKIGLNFGTLMNYGFVARRVKTSCRNEVLSFTHHWVAARFESSALQKQWLAKAAKHQWSVREFRLACDRRDEKELEKDPDTRAHLWFERLEKFVGRVSQVIPEKMEDEPLLDHVSLHHYEVQNLAKLARQAAECCNGMADSLERYWRKRKIQGAAFKKRPITEPVRPLWVDVMFGDKTRPPAGWDDDEPLAEAAE